MWLARLILRTFGWKVEVNAPAYPKCIICVAPHTSNYDFILGKLAYASVGRHAGFLMKDTWFFFPMGSFFRAIGGVPVPRKRKRNGSLVDALVERFRTSDRLTIAITPEGTRSRTSNWHTGFLRIAYEAQVPIVLGVIDYRQKLIIVNDTYTLTGDINEDMCRIKNYYRPFEGKYPQNFCAD